MAPTVRTLDQIISEIGGVYAPQITSLQSQAADIPNQVRAEEQGLEAKQKNAFGDILSAARRRGTGVAFGGIPLSEQADYTADVYMPALANLRTAAKTQATSLQDAINQIHERRQNAALSLQQTDQSRYDSWKAQQDALAESRRQAAAQTSDISRYFGNLGGSGETGTAQPRGTFMQPKTDGSGGFTFLNQNGKAISAAQYAASKQIPFRDLLSMMAKKGDAGAKVALGFTGNDFGYDPTKIGKYGTLYNSLVWGTGKAWTPSKTTPLAPAKTVSATMNNTMFNNALNTVRR